ncbi:MAG: histidine kinase N-terminal 7TM domain-containing protein [Methanocella sp.]
MDIQLSIFSTVFATAAAIIAAIFLYVWQKRRSPGGLYFSLFMAAAAEWTLMSAMEYSVADMPSKILFATLAYPGVATVAPLWFIFALDYSRRTRWLRSRWLTLIWVVPIAVILLAFTNEWHGLTWPVITPASGEPGAILLYSLGLAVMANAVYAYALLIGGSIILLKAALRSSGRSFLPIMIIVVGTLVSLVTNLLYPTSLNPVKGLDITPLAFMISGLLFTWAIFGQRLFELLPVAREKLIQVMPDGAIVMDCDRKVVEINPAARRMLSLSENLAVDDIGRVTDRWPALAGCFKSGADAELDVMIDGPEGAAWLDTRVSVLYDTRGKQAGRLVVLRDVTKRKHADEELKRSNEALSASLHEKEVLLKEVHHRVKNNLQIVSSILSLQSGSACSESQATLLRESQDRIRSMALVHEKLYRSRDLSRINFGEYVHSLIASLARSYIASPAITTRIEVPDIYLDIDGAIPCGLIINELVSNSLKYAFRDGRAGEVCVSLSRREGIYTLVVSDDGAGLPPDLDFRNTASLGLQLVNTLVGQLEGTIELDSAGGTMFRITFVRPQSDSK